MNIFLNRSILITMNQKDLLSSISKYLSRFQAQVGILNANSEYDINIHAENVLIPILNLIYGANLVNTNYFDSKNNVAIDLIDESKKIMFQVTSTDTLDKIKSTLKKTLTSKYKSKVGTLYIYMLRVKKPKYSQFVFDSITKGKIKFNYEKHVIDSGDLYRELSKLNDLDIIIKVEEILRKQFSDLNLNEDFSFDKFEEFKVLYRESCLTNFSRINFFGLSVNSINRPREIDLYSLFVKPRFSPINSGFDKYFSSLVSNISFINDANPNDAVALLDFRTDKN